jgi:hypothetical protein
MAVPRQRPQSTTFAVDLRDAAGRMGTGGLMSSEEANGDRPITIGYTIAVVLATMALPLALAATCYWLLTRSP